MNIQKVTERMEQKNITVPMMSNKLGINPSTWYRKIKKDGDGFTALDLLVIKRELELSEQEALDFLLS